MKLLYLTSAVLFMALAIPIKTNATDLTENQTENQTDELISNVLNQYKNKVSDSIKLFEETERESWSYKVVRFEDEEGDVSSSTEVFTPNKNKSNQWALLKLNGKQPTQKQQKKFVKDKTELSSQTNLNQTNLSRTNRKALTSKLN